MAPDQKQTKRPFWISNKLAKQKVHQWRSEESSILVGVQTVIEDNPMLTTREWPGKNPLRLILDPSNRINSHATVLNDKFPTVVLNRERNLPFEKQHISRAVLDPYSLESLMKFCYTQNLLSLFVEGGQKTLTSFLRNDLWDEVRVFQSENDIKKGLKAPVLNTPHHNEEKIGDNWLKIYFNQTIPSKIQDIV
jgi:diaminohydroxyphosphoribosylaminopyrimidine deaminase/5-amino-6-(5-phosphoribosylamino)uracil reductase